VPESSTVAIADLAARMRRDGHDIVDFSAGRAAEHSPSIVCDTAIEAMRQGRTHQTEARGLPEYLLACTKKLHSVNKLELDPASNVIATLGCKQGLLLSLLAVIDIGDEVIIEDPCFVSYAPAIELFGGVPVIVPTDRENRFCWSEERLEAAITDKTRAILFCSPHNPAGVVHTLDDLQAIANVAIRHDLTVIADEIYEAVCWGDRTHLPIYSLPHMQSRTIGLMGMTKTYSMGGWRIGYAYAAPNYIEAMTKIQQHLMTCASSFGQLGAARALQTDVIESMGSLWKDWESRCEYVTQELDAHERLSVTMPEGGFYAWVNIGASGLTSQEFCTRLVQEKQVAAVPGVTFGPACDDYFRITCVRSWKEVKEGVRRVKQFVDEL
jgi:aspartate/methionine/tyrosine aminotransferase